MICWTMARLFKAVPPCAAAALHRNVLCGLYPPGVTFWAFRCPASESGKFLSADRPGAWIRVGSKRTVEIYG